MRTTLFLLSLTIVLANCNKTKVDDCCTGDPQIAAVDSSVIAVPDIFTPNADGVNDLLYVRTKNIASLTLTITKRSGKVLFESSDMSTGWDGTYKGKNVKEKEFSFTVDARTLSGKSLNLSGKVCIIRDNCAKGPLQNCFFDCQFNGTTFDRNIPTNENIKMCD